jgi:hypothetical protein
MSAIKSEGENWQVMVDANKDSKSSDFIRIS